MYEKNIYLCHKLNTITGDPDYDYYLLKVTSYGVVELDEAMTDDYGSSFPKGSIGL